LVVESFDFGDIRQYTIQYLGQSGYPGEDFFYWFYEFELTITGDYDFSDEEGIIKIDKPQFDLDQEFLEEPSNSSPQILSPPLEIIESFVGEEQI